MHHLRGLINDKPRYYRMRGDICRTVHDSSKASGII